MHLEKRDRLRHKLPLPTKLIEMLESGKWVHPGNSIMQEKIPFIRDPVVFLNSKDSMLCHSVPLMGPEEIENERFSEYRGSAIGKRDLPWIDVEQTLVIICNQWPGDDVGIALDYRVEIDTPRVVGGDWHSETHLVYREIAPTFDRFVDLLGLLA